MLNELCHLHSKLNPDQMLKIVFAEDMHVLCDKTDLVRKSDNCFRIMRANGRIVTVNPSRVMYVCTVSKGGVL